MIIAIVFASMWGVLQLIVLGSMARTVRVRTVITALLVGLYACAPLAVLLQVAWGRPAAWLSGMSFSVFVGIAGHTVDPFIEEIVKVLPVLVLLMTPSILWFEVGGRPQTAGVQTMLMGPVAWKVVVALSGVSQALTAWYLVVSMRAWPTARRFPVGDDGAIVRLRMARQFGALALGGYALLLAFTGVSPTHALFSNAHALAAMSALTMGGASMKTGMFPIQLLGAVDIGLGERELLNQADEAAADAAAAAADPVAKARAARDLWEKAEARQAAASHTYTNYRAELDRLNRAAADADTAVKHRGADREANSPLSPVATKLADDRAGQAHDAAAKANHEAEAARGALKGAIAGLKVARADADAAAKVYESAARAGAEAQTRAGAAAP